MIISLLRHGETDLNRTNCFQGTIDVPLNERGIQQALQAKAALHAHFDVVYASPLTRAIETATLLVPEHKPIIDARLCEFDYGLYEGTPFLEAPPELTAFVFHPTTVSPPSTVESITSLKTRAASFLNELISTYTTEHILIVSHGVIMRAMIGSLKHLSDDDIWSMDLPHCQLITIDLSKKQEAD